jgi:hypothetical protein
MAAIMGDSCVAHHVAPTSPVQKGQALSDAAFEGSIDKLVSAK